MNQTVNETEAAKILSLAVQTLRNWRHQRKGLPYIKIGRAVRYKVDDIKEYLNNHTIRFDDNESL